MPSYKLDVEPWIPVVLENGSAKEVSLEQLFTHARGIQRLGGSPLEVAVLHRLLLAIMHQATNPADAGAWYDLWRAPEQPMHRALEYVRSHRESFDLYDEHRPFMQHTSLPYGQKPLAVLVYDRAQGNNPIFLDASSEADRTPIPSSLAARSLLVNLAFGGSHPDKSSPLGTAKDNTMYAGPLCARLVAIVEGENLAKTLILNLAHGQKAGKPAWDRPIPVGPGSREVDGISDRFARLTRFIRLQPSKDGQQCISVALHMGEKISEDEEKPSDPMIPLYLAKDKKFKVQRLEPDRALWRSASVLLNSKVSDMAAPIRALDQLNPFVQTGEVSRDEKVSLRVVGVSGNAQGPKTDLWRDETLPFSLSIVADDDHFDALVQAVEFADEVGSQLRRRVYSFSQRFLEAASPNPDPKDVGKMADELAPGLYDYWATIGPNGERLGISAIDPGQWQALVKSAANRAYNLAVDRLPPSANRFRAQVEKPSKDASKSTEKKGAKKSA